MPEEINMQSQVLMHYSLGLTDGTILESSFEDEPIEIKMGDQDLTDGMELAVYGLKVGDEQTITLTPEQGYGYRDEENIHDMPLSDFPEELKPEAGLVYSFEGPDGEEIPGTILKLKEDTVSIDFNHPLAGHDLVFRVEILDIINSDTDSSDEEL